MKKFEKIVASTPFEASERLAKIKSGSDVMVLMSGRLYEALKRIGTTPEVSYKHWFTGDASVSQIETFKIFDLHTLHCVPISLMNKTAWVALVGIDSKEFTGGMDHELYVCDLI